MTLETLFTRYRETGEPDALARVFDDSARELFKVAAHLSGSTAEAEDLVQETFLAAITEADRWDPARRLLPWLLGILAHKAGTLARRTGRRVDAHRLRLEEPVDPATQAADAEVKKTVHQEVDRLPEPYGKVLKMHLLQGLGAVGVAQALGRAPSTVRTQIQRGMDLLRRALPAGMAPGFVALEGRGLEAVRQVVLDQAAAAAAAGTATAAGTLATGSTTTAGSATAGSTTGTTAVTATALAAGGVMMKKTILVGTLLILTALGVGLWQADLFAPAASMDDPAETPGLTAEEPGKAPGTDVHTAAEKGTRTPLDGPAPSRGAGLLGKLPLEATLRLRVVDGTTGDPLPGARIAWHAPRLARTGIQDALPAALDNPYLSVTVNVPCLLDPAPPLESLGRVVVADERGEFAIPRVPGEKGRLRLWGRHGDLEGGRVLPVDLRQAGPDRLDTLKLLPVHRVPVQVVDRGGQPRAGVNLAVVARHPGPNTEFARIWQGRSDADGTATARFQLPDRIRKWRLSLLHLPASKGGAQVSLPNPAARGTDPQPTADPTAPVRLVLGPTAPVAVHVVDSQGQTVPDRLLVRLYIRNTGLGEITGGLAAYTDQGKVHFSHLPLGPTLHFRLSQPGRRPDFAGRSFTGLTVADRLQELELTWPAPGTTYRGRALDATGKVLAGIPIHANGQVFLTDAGGRFAVRREHDLRRPRSRGEKVKLTWWRRTSDLGLPHGPTATLDIPGPIAVTGLEVGDVVFEPLQEVGRGVVRDPQGRPVPQVKIDPRRLNDKGYSTETLTPILTDSQGRFTVHADRAGPVHVRPLKTGWVCPWRFTLLDGGGVETAITLERSGSLEFDLKVDPELPARMIKVRLWNEKPSFAGWKMGMIFPFCRMKEVKPEELRDLYPGTYTLLVSARDMPLARIGGIPIRSGKRTRPPELQPLDLTGRVKAYRFTLRLPGKHRPGDIHFLVRPPKGDHMTSLEGTWIPPLTYVVALPPETAPIIVSVAGFQPVIFTDPRPVNTVDLTGVPPTIPLRLKVTATPKGFAGFPTLEYTGPPKAGLSTQALDQAVTMSFSSSTPKVYAFQLPCVGPYRVVWQWRPGGSHRTPMELMKQPVYKTIQVERTATPRLVEVALTAADLPATGG